MPGQAVPCLARVSLAGPCRAGPAHLARFDRPTVGSPLGVPTIRSTRPSRWARPRARVESNRIGASKRRRRRHRRRAAAASSHQAFGSAACGGPDGWRASAEASPTGVVRRRRQSRRTACSSSRPAAAQVKPTGTRA